MSERQALVILTCTVALMALTLVRPSSGLRNIVFGLMLTGMALIGIVFGIKGLLGSITGMDRDRGTPRGATPPTPPGIRVRTTAVRSG